MSCPHCRYPFTLPPKGMVTRTEPIPSAHFTRECSNCGALFRFEVVQVKGPTREEYPVQKANGGSGTSIQPMMPLAGATERVR